MKKALLLLFVLVSVLFSACAPDDGSDKILCNTEKVNDIVTAFGSSDAQKLIIKKPYARALDCNVYLIYVVEDGIIKEYTCEFYGNLAEHNYALDYYDTDSVKELYMIIHNDPEACMVCVLNLTVEFESIQNLREHYSDKHYIKQGYEIIE